MKKCLIIMSIFFVTASFVQAKGIFVNPGVRANSMAAAYVGVADDLSAIWFNPAGLAQQEGAKVEASAFYAAPKAESNVSLGNSIAMNMADGDFPLPPFYDYAALVLGLPVPAGLEPTVYQSKELETSAVVPFIAGCTKVNDITIAAGFYGAGGGGGTWEDTVAGALIPTDQISASLEATFGVMIGNISAAKKFNEKLSLGLGLNYLYMIDNNKMEKTYVASATSKLMGINGYGMSVEQSGTGTGMEVTAGAMYEPSEKCKLGFVFRSGSTIKQSGTAKIVTTGDAAGMSHETDYDKDYKYPMTYGLGVSYQATEKLLVSAAVDISNYSAFEDTIDYETPDASGFLSDTDGVDLEWENSTQFRIGAEYCVNEKLCLRTGAYNDPTSAPTDNLTLINTNQYAYITMNLGAGYEVNENIDVDLNIGYALSDKPTKNGREYEYPAMTYRLGVGYNF